MEHLNEIFEFRVLKPEQLNEILESRGAALMNPDQEQLDDGLASVEYLKTVYRNYLRTRQRSAILEGLLRDYNHLKSLFSTVYIYIGPTGALEELNMLTAQDHPGLTEDKYFLLS